MLIAVLLLQFALPDLPAWLNLIITALIGAVVYISSLLLIGRSLVDSIVDMLLKMANKR